MKKQFGEYYLGLDMGTGSLGWAVTDLNYNLEKLHGKALWGIRLFENAQTAADCRIQRGARRRLERKTWRLNLLQELFAEEISRKDPGFYLRLKESNFWPEDRSIDNNQKYSLFNDAAYSDKKYYMDYPTIYHLRKALLENKKAFDVRLVYLAIHNILKYRGHFLFAGLKADAITDFTRVFADVRQYLQDNVTGLENWNCTDPETVKKILKDRKMSVTNKKKQLEALFSAESKQEKAVVALLAGGTAKLCDLFVDEELKEVEKASLSFSKDNYDEIQQILKEELADRVEAIEKLKALYDWSLLTEILKDNTFISYAKCAVYEEHAHDLEILKQVVKKYIPKEYKNIFGAQQGKTANYSSYIGMYKINGTKEGVEKKCNQEDICKFLSTKLKDIRSDDANLKIIREKLALGIFLPKQVDKNNGIIPMQIHLVELEKILENASAYLPFLNNVDEAGNTIKSKIIDIMKFRIPYYVGPLNGTAMSKAKKRCWVVRSSDKIYPWNFEKVVNLEASAENFIRNMTNKCTYLTCEDVLPKNSLLYTEFMVRNEINNLKLDGMPISAGLKEQIFQDLFMQATKTRKLTLKKLAAYLKTENICGEVTGIDIDFKTSLKSYHDFYKIFGNDIIKNSAMIEKIILWITLFSNEKNMLIRKIKGNYPTVSETQIKQIKELNYADWGRFSQTLLDSAEIAYVDETTGEAVTILHAMKESGLNFMELLAKNCKYNFAQKIEAFNNANSSLEDDLTYKTVDDLYVSPAVKRQIWQTITVVDELKGIMQHAPKKIFVEMARGEEEKKRTKSRKDRLMELYKACREDVKELLTELESSSDSDLRSEKLYLYYTQMGRDMYDTSKVIDVEQLMSSNIWDKDHIYPRSKTKDDSFDNLVLVNKAANAHKTDTYPLPAAVQSKNRGFWKLLLEKGFISQRKYDRLTRTTALSEDELADFIARQIVETRQSTKAVAQILTQVFKDTQIIYVKAGTVSDFRQVNEFTKVRDVNDYHHAKDAYLNIVVGNVYNTKFTNNPANFIKHLNGERYTLNPEKLYNFDVKNAWKAGKEGTISRVREIMSKNNILFTRHSYEGKGQLFDVNILKRGNGQVPVKKNWDIKKYGGYNSASTAYFTLVESVNKKGEKIRTIETVPMHIAKEIEKNEHGLETFLRKVDLLEPRVIIPKIKIKSLFVIDGYPMHISGRTGEQIMFWGAVELVLTAEQDSYAKKICKYIDRNKKANIKSGYLPINSLYDGITKNKNLELYDALLIKQKKTIYKKRPASQIKMVETSRDKFISLNIEEQSLVLKEILSLFTCSAASTNFELLGGGRQAGILKVSKNITDRAQAYIINQSPTGIFEQKVDLLRL